MAKRGNPAMAGKTGYHNMIIYEVNSQKYEVDLGSCRFIQDHILTH